MNSSLAEYARLLQAWPGLVARGQEPGGLVEDSLALLGLLGTEEAGARLIDVGSGGGMPGIPLKIARPGLRVTLLEADRAKAAFLLSTAAQLGLELEVVAERAELAARGPLREAFDVAVCRALAGFATACELCLPFVRVGGRMLAMAAEAPPSGWPPAPARALGGASPTPHPAPSPARERGVVVEIAKVAATPAAYPRRPGVPRRRPLEE